MAKEQKISAKKQAAPIQPTLPIPEDTLEYAIRLQQQWRFEEAKAQYLALLKETPEDADALHNLGVLFSVQLLEPKEALSYFEAALNINPTRLQFWFSYLDALIKAGDTPMAEQVLMLASNYGLNELQIASLNRDITLASTTVMDLVDMVLADAPPLPAPQPIAAAQPPAGAEPGIGDLQKLLSVFNQKKYQPAIQLIQSMRQKYPHSVEVLKILAETEKRAGHLDKALAARRQAAEQQPTQVANQMALADALLDMALKDEAETLLQAILLMQPDYAPALEKMGVLYQNREEFLPALQNYAWAIKNNGINSFVLEKFGASFRALGYQDAALICFKYAVYNSPEKTPELFTAYGVTLRNQERYAAAEDAFRMALKIHSGHIPALHNLCHLLEHYGRFAEAEAGFMRCAELEKGSAATLYEVGRNLLEQKRETEAADWLRRAIQAKPDFVHAHVMLSKALNASEEPSVVIEEIKASIKALPHIPALHTNLGVVYLNLSRADEAIAAFRQALAIDPNFTHARTSMLFALSHSSKITPEELYREHRSYGKLIEASVKGKEYTSYNNTPLPDRALKVGFVSADFRNHAVAQFVIPFFETLKNHEEITTYAYVNHGARDGATLAIEKNIHVWRPVVGWSDDELAEKIREDQIDILVDLSGHTAGNRLGVFARRPAPVQVTWLGYPGTTGLKAIDYKFISDAMLKPNNNKKLQKQFSEKFVILPSGLLFKKRDMGWGDNDNAPCLKNGYITFGSFNRLNKINEGVVKFWCDILKILPNSKLLMGAMPSNGAPEEVLKWFGNEGVGADRVFFYPRTNLADYIKLHEQVDLCLDTFPYTGGTTTSHALQLGVPTLTVVGDYYAGRQTSSLLYRFGLGEGFSGKDFEDVKRLAVIWDKNPEILNKVRKELRAKIYQEYDFLREITVVGMIGGFRAMWRNWCAGNKPRELIADVQGIGNLLFPYKEDILRIVSLE